MAKTKKIPKRLAGVKVPKALRRGLRDLASSQTGRTILLEALAAAGAALTATQAQPGSKTRRAASAQAPKISAAADELRRNAADARAAAVAALEDAARSFTDALRRSGTETPKAPPPQTTPPSAATH